MKRLIAVLAVVVMLVLSFMGCATLTDIGVFGNSKEQVTLDLSEERYEDQKHRADQAQLEIHRRRLSYVTAHPDLSTESRRAILAGHVRTGFSQEEVVVSWGEPKSVRNSYYGDGVLREQWEYHLQYLYFEADRLVAWN